MGSLKEKRRLLKSLITRLRNSFNVSVSEVDDNDVLRTATLGIAIAANSSSFAHQVINRVMDRINTEPEIIVAEFQSESY